MINHTNASFFLGPRTNIPLQDLPGWAHFFTPQELWNEQFRAGASITGLMCSEELQCLMLEPSAASLYTTNMSLSNVKIVAGTWSDDAHPDGPDKPSWLYCRVADSNDGIQSKHALPANPTIFLWINRHPLPQENDDRNWKLYVGGEKGFTLTWGTKIKPTVVTPDGITHTLFLDFDEYQQYFQTLEMSLKIFVDGDRILLYSNLWNKPWIIYTQDGSAWNIPSSAWMLLSSNVTYTCYLSTPQYGMVGNLITGWMDLGNVYNNDDLIFDILPNSTINPSSMLVNVVAETHPTIATKKRFKILVSSYNGDTPRIQAVRVYFMPTFLEGTDTWLDITRYVKEATERKYYELGQPADLQLTIDLQKPYYYGRPFFPYLKHELGDALHGVYCLKYATGFDYDDDTTTTCERMTGLLELRTPTHDLLAEELTNTIARDGWTILQKREAWGCPCVTDLYMVDALTLWLQWGGIHPANIVSEIASGTDIRVNEPHRGYSNPQWRPEGAARMGELIKRLCEAKGYRVEFAADGKAHIKLRAPQSLTPFASLSSFADSSADQLCKIESIEDATDAVGLVVVIGKPLEECPDAVVPYYELYDLTAMTPGSDTFTGNIQTQRIEDENLRTVAECGIMCYHVFAARKSGLPRLRVQSHYAGWNCLPGDIVSIDDVVTIGRNVLTTPPTQRLCRVVELTNTVRYATIECVLLCEQLNDIDLS